MVDTVTQHIMINVGGKQFDSHYYTRYIKPKTELWIFTVGMGDQAVMEQLGEAFLTQPDPEMGRIMLSIGWNEMAPRSFRGDFNAWYAFGNTTTFVEDYINHTTVQPCFVLAASKKAMNRCLELGLNAVHCPFAVGPSYKPLGLERHGIGYVGGDGKSPEQQRLIMQPFLSRSDFSWHGHGKRDRWLSAAEVNEWYNHRQIALGMLNDVSTLWDVVPNRVQEIIASGTPLVMPRHSGWEETFGFKQPYAVDKQGETEQFANAILEEYDGALRAATDLSGAIRSRFSYVDVLGKLISGLRESRK